LSEAVREKRKDNRADIIDEFHKFLRDEIKLKIDKSNVLTTIYRPNAVLRDLNEIVRFYNGVGKFIEKKIREKVGKKNIYVEYTPYDESFSIIRVTGRFKFGNKVREIVLFKKMVADDEVASSKENFEEFINTVADSVEREYNSVVRFFNKIKKEIITSQGKLVTIHFADIDGYVDDTLVAIVPREMTEEKLQEIVDKIKDEIGRGVWSTADIYDMLEKKYNVKFIRTSDDYEIEV
jgi:hypothetical protein